MSRSIHEDNPLIQRAVLKEPQVIDVTPKGEDEEESGQNIGSLVAENQHRFKFKGDVVAMGTASLPEEQREALRWLAQHCRERNMSHTAVAPQIIKANGEAYSADSLSQAWTGKRAAEGADLGPLCQSINKYRRRMEETAPTLSVEFIETDLTRQIFRICTSALKKQQLVFIWGESQIGKSVTLDAFARMHPGSVTFVSMPVGGKLTDFIDELATSCNIPMNLPLREKKRRCMDVFDKSTTLIVDELHQCFLTSISARNVEVLEFLRILRDRRKCGLVGVGTNVLKYHMHNGGSSKVLKQLVRRSSQSLQLPDRPSLKVLAEIATRHGLEPAHEREVGVAATVTDQATGEERVMRLKRVPLKIQEDVITKHGLGRWFQVLAQAKDLAKAVGKEISWAAVINAHCEMLANEQVFSEVH